MNYVMSVDKYYKFSLSPHQSLLTSKKFTSYLGSLAAVCQIVPTPLISGQGKHRFFYSNRSY